jgi:hypothetical protein
VKLNRLETHDRYEHFTKQDFDIGACCQNLIDQRPFGEHAFYIFAHPRTNDDGVTKRLIWQPRLTRPTPQTNSMLFKAYPGSDTVKIIWMIPDRALWKQYEKGNITDNDTVRQSIHDFTHNRELLSRKEPDDLEDWQIDNIYRSISNDANLRKANVWLPKN